MPRDPRVLILGSMPGEESLRRGQYYAYPRNAFWPIMAALLEEPLPAVYKARTELLVRHSIAVWDVVGSCFREGSLDQNIRSETLNDFAALFADFPEIRHVFCNGTAAYTLFTRNIHLPSDIGLTRLPSTSPAHAVPFEKKLEAWRQVTAFLR
jgi:double-stranded uracil-DNA glycosylase